MPLSTDFQSSNLNALFAQTRQLSIAKDEVVFKRSWFNNRFPGIGDHIISYFVQSNNYGTLPIVSQQTEATVGFLNYRLRQSNVKKNTNY